MSFTSDVKKELSMREYDPKEERAVLSALIQMTATLNISSRGMALEAVTENSPVSRTIYRMVRSRYQAEIETSVRKRMNLNKNSIYVLRIYGPVTEILKDLGIYSARGLLDRPLQKIVSNDAAAKAYLAGAFMADGSVNSPQTSGYHLEIKAGNEVHADFLIGLMERFDIRAKRIRRRGKWVVYLKSSEKISDFLRAAGAYQCLLEFENERISRDFLNSMQRLNNVDVANEVKSMKASKEQLADIALLEEWDQLRYLDEKVIDVALLRKDNPEATLNELAKIYEEKTGISVSKSGLKHRFVKIRERAEKVRKEHCD